MHFFLKLKMNKSSAYFLGLCSAIIILLAFWLLSEVNTSIKDAYNIVMCG
jgi:hypothetical protein